MKQYETDIDMKYALVTGGSRGIGRAICVRLAEMGYAILINYRSNDKEAKATLKMVKDAGTDGELMKFDIANQKDIEDTLGSWIDNNEDKQIEVLVNNAGITKDNLLMWMKDEEWRDVMKTNLDSFFFITRRVVRGMLSRKYGRIINIVSLSGLRGMPGQTNYSATKAGIIGATKALAQEIGRRKITVNAVAPGFINTEMIAGIDEKTFRPLIPAGRFGEPEEVAEVVAFLACEKASYVTGEVISVNGGMYT